MTNIEAIRLLLNNNLGIESIENAQMLVDYAKHEIEISEKVLSQFKKLNEEALTYIAHIVFDLKENIKTCNAFLEWRKNLVFRKIQELYGVYQRQKHYGEGIRAIDLNLRQDLAYLRNVVKRDIRNSGYGLDDLKPDDMDIMPDEITFAYSGKYPDCIELYSPTAGKGLIWNPKTKSAVKSIKED